MAKSKSVAARVHQDVHEWLKQEAESRGTTLGSLVEDMLREKYKSQQPSPEMEGRNRRLSSTSGGGKTLPNAVYTPKSHKYDYAVRVYDTKKEKSVNKYYKTKRGVLDAIDRWEDSERWEMRP